MKKLRLLALTTSYPLRPGACAGVFVQSLYRRLAVEYTIDVVCPGDSRPSAAIFVDDTGADIRVNAVHYAPRNWRVVAQDAGGVVSSVRRAPWRLVLVPLLLATMFWRLLRRGDVDLIHANWAVCGVVAGVVGRLRRKPVITTLRGSDVARAERSWLDRMILGAAVHYSRILICVSEAMARQLRLQFPRRADDIQACLNGTDEAFFQIQRDGTGDGLLRVLAVGNLIRLKGFDVLIDAVARMQQRSRIRVRIIGDGPERQSLLALVKSSGVSECVEFVGAIATGEMPAQFSNAEVFVLSSRREGRPNVVMEALASGLPVISTDLDGVQGMVESGDNGWLVAVDDAAGLAAALDQAVVDRVELSRRGERARATARVRVGTWADTANAYRALFHAALPTSERPCPPCAE